MQNTLMEKYGVDNIFRTSKKKVKW
jgi:hypothetical protein